MKEYIEKYDDVYESVLKYPILKKAYDGVTFNSEILNDEIGYGLIQRDEECTAESMNRYLSKLEEMGKDIYSI